MAQPPPPPPPPLAHQQPLPRGHQNHATELPLPPQEQALTVHRTSSPFWTFWTRSLSRLLHPPHPLPLPLHHRALQHLPDTCSSSNSRSNNNSNSISSTLTHDPHGSEAFGRLPAKLSRLHKPLSKAPSRLPWRARLARPLRSVSRDSSTLITLARLVCAHQLLYIRCWVRR